MTSESQPTTVEPLGARVKRLRTERKMSQERLAIEARVDQSGLSKFERGRDRSIAEPPLRRIAAALGLAFEDVVGGTDYASTVNVRGVGEPQG